MAKSEAILGVALFGLNGHQLHDKLQKRPDARVIAIGGAARDQWPGWLARDASVTDLSLNDMLQHSGINLVVLCSPQRNEQAQQAIRCLQAGKHVYAEKPCALNESDLDRIIAVASENGRVFREMNDTMFTPPFHHMREIIRRGAVGRVLQVFAQKSYPLAGKPRPTDDDTDGGLLRQVGVHAVRMIEHVAGMRVADDAEAIQVIESVSEDLAGRPIVSACSLNLRLVGGGVATAVCNYLNPLAFPTWGNETLRVFGTEGMIECTDGGANSRWVTHDQDHGPWHHGAPPAQDPFDELLQEIRGAPGGLLPLEADLHPTRVVLRAFNTARRIGG